MNKSVEYYHLGLDFEKRGDVIHALKYYRASAKEDPSFRPAFNNLGVIYSRQGRADLAIGFFRQALELGEDAAIYFNLGSESFRLERFDHSEKYLKKALSFDRRMLKAHLLLAYLYGKKRDFASAEIYFKNALLLEPANRTAVLGMTVMLSEQERYDEALKTVDSFLALRPDDVSLRDLRAGLLLKTNRLKESLDEYSTLSRTSEKFTSFTEHLEAAKRESDAAYGAFFEDVDDKIRRRTERLRERLKTKREEGGQTAGTPEQDIRDLMDLSFLHLFNGDSDRALKFLFEARRRKPVAER
jgi:tetratricopeptide (TPR) repeat protein